MKRRAGLWIVLLATLAGSAWLATQEAEDAVALVREPAPSSSTASSRESIAVVPWPAPPTTRASEAWSFDAERALAWSAPPPTAPPPAVAVALPAPVTPAVATAPQAPPFPYVLIGRIEEGSAVHALLFSPSQTLGVKVQDVIDSQWRVDAIDARGLALTWLPGGLRQTVSFRSS